VTYLVCPALFTPSLPIPFLDVYIPCNKRHTLQPVWTFISLSPAACLHVTQRLFILPANITPLFPGVIALPSHRLRHQHSRRVLAARAHTQPHLLRLLRYVMLRLQSRLRLLLRLAAIALLLPRCLLMVYLPAAFALPTSPFTFAT